MAAATKAPMSETMDTEIQPMDQHVPQDEKSGTALDDNDMHRMGKVQELKVCSSYLGTYLLFFGLPSDISQNREICDLRLHWGLLPLFKQHGSLF